MMVRLLRHALSAGLFGAIVGFAGGWVTYRFVGQVPRAMEFVPVRSGEYEFDSAIKSEVSRLSDVVAGLEAHMRGSEGQESTRDAAAKGGKGGDGAEVQMRLERLNERLSTLEAVLEEFESTSASDGVNQRPPGRADAEAVRRLTAQVLDTTLSNRVRLESLELLGKLSAQYDPFRGVSLDEVGSFIDGVHDSRWRGKAYRYIEGHVDATWKPWLLDALKRESNDDVRMRVVELLGSLVSDPDVRRVLVGIEADSDTGPRTRDTIRDMIRRD